MSLTHEIGFILQFNYTLCESTLDRLSTVKDLGVVFNAKLSFVPHIEQVAASASKSLGFVLRNCKHFANQSTNKVLYNSYVRSIGLRFNSVVPYIQLPHSNS